MAYVLIVDDERAFRSMLSDVVGGEGLSVRTASSGEQALDLVAEQRPSLVLLDLRMGPGAMNGLETLEAMTAKHADLPVVMVTGFGDVQTAVAAMKAGALDFLEKPVDLAEVRAILHRVLGPAGTEEEGARSAVPFGGITPADAPMRDAVELLARVAKTDAVVLIAGESGTGKELAATFIHRQSDRHAGPFVKVNCAAIPGGLLEAEMFGCCAGAYTGATRARKGRFAAAEGGTLLLDEIAEMDVAMQAKLLRVLQEREFEPVGSSRPKKADVRVVAATNRSLPDALAEGSFREDLYYRLNVFEVVLPPLRERPGDILPLAEHFAREFSPDRARRLSEPVEDLFLQHPWPGNIRELRNAIERAVILARGGVIHPEHLPPNIDPQGSEARTTPPAFRARAGASMHEMERDLIARTLAALDGNRTRAAESLGISRRALQYKIKRYGLDGDR